MKRGNKAAFQQERAEKGVIKQLITTAVFLCLVLTIYTNPPLIKDFLSKVKTIDLVPFEIKKALPVTSQNGPSPSPAYIKEAQVTQKPSPTDTQPWGVAKQLSEHLWTIKLGEDARMATPQEILVALNNYRARYGSQPLRWDEKLASYAQSRADFFNSSGKLDSHVGFEDFLNNQDGFSKLGYNSLGENSSIGYKLLAVHLIEWVYAGDPGHDSNQKNPDWDHVGVGVSGTATDLIFATSPR